jgi:uncharacterized metal-binding protein YceD (DUF177 family)
MPLLINLRLLENQPLVLRGELPVSELDLEGVDELIHTPKTLTYDLVAQSVGNDVLVQGRLQMGLECECARCLKSFVKPLDLSRWAVHLPLEGEDKVAIENDCVDLTPFLREDILLQFPQHPLCEPGCCGLSITPPGSDKKSSGASQKVETSSAWAELNKLKFEKE